MSNLIFVMIFLPVESMYNHYFCAGIDIPTISLTMCVSLVFDSGLGLGSDAWCSDFLVGPRRNMKDLPRPSPVEGSSNSTQYIWLQFNQSYSFST